MEGKHDTLLDYDDLCQRYGLSRPQFSLAFGQKPEALLLAGQLESGEPVTGSAAAELRRLHEVNQELLGACKAALSDDQPYIEKCRAAIAKATGEDA